MREVWLGQEEEEDEAAQGRGNKFGGPPQGQASGNRGGEKEERQKWLGKSNRETAGRGHVWTPNMDMINSIK